MPTRTFDRLNEEKKERVMRAAIEEFVTKDYAKAKIETIARNAGVAKGSVYQYFQDKKELFLYCITWTLNYYMQEINQQTPLLDMDLFDYLLTAGQERFTLLQKDPMLLAFTTYVTNGHYGSLTGELNDSMQQISNRYVSQLIANGKKKGSIRRDLDDAAILLVYQGVTEKLGMTVMEMARRSNYEFTPAQFDEVAQIVTNIVAILQKGIGEC